MGCTPLVCGTAMALFSVPFALALVLCLPSCHCPTPSPALLCRPSTAVRQLRGESGAAAAADQGVGAPPNLGFSQEEPADVEAAYVAALEDLSVRSCPAGDMGCGLSFPLLRLCRRPCHGHMPAFHWVDSCFWSLTLCHTSHLLHSYTLQVGDFDSSAARAYNRSFAAKAERQEGDRTGGSHRSCLEAWVVGARLLERVCQQQHSPGAVWPGQRDWTQEVCAV